jgi:hypothetical protein
MMDYLCGKCHSFLPLGETVCEVCCFDNQPTVTIQGEAMTSPNAARECFVCKMPLVKWKCMTPTCPKDKDNHTNDDSCIVCKTLGTESKCIAPDCPKNKDPYTLSREAIISRFNDKAEEAANAFSGVFGTIKSDGGPSTYFDLCNGGTLNDELERKGDEQWLGDSFHLGNVVKLAWRWGIKEGTDKAYDANKLIYSGARLLMKYKGVSAVRKSLQKLLDDPQFQEREKDK